MTNKEIIFSNITIKENTEEGKKSQNKNLTENNEKLNNHNLNQTNSYNNDYLNNKTGILNLNSLGENIKNINKEKHKNLFQDLINEVEKDKLYFQGWIKYIHYKENNNNDKDKDNYKNKDMDKDKDEDKNKDKEKDKIKSINSNTKPKSFLINNEFFNEYKIIKNNIHNQYSNYINKTDEVKIINNK
jgi:hypothetical protein